MNALQAHSDVALPLVAHPDDRARNGWLVALCKDIHAAPRTVDAIRAAVAAHPGRLSFGTLKTQYYKWLKRGEDGLVDQRKVKRHGRLNVWAACFMTYCENHDRSNKGAWKVMIEDFWDGRHLPHGVGDWRDQWRIHRSGKPLPAECPAGWFPPCARYETLQRAIGRKVNPDYDFQIIGARRGRKAAHEYLHPVLTTRAGLQPGQVTQWDDVTLDLKTRLPGKGKIARPQMFIGIDVASGMRVASVIRPQYAETPGGKRNSLKERDFRMLHAWWCTDVGIHPESPRSVIEHGTTAIRPTLEKKYKSIPRFGQLLSFDRSGILAEQLHAGLFKGNGGGNFRRKPHVEQNHRMLHSALAALPGQVGQDSDHQPESLPALLRYEELIMQAETSLSERERAAIVHSLLTFNEFVPIMERLCDGIWDATDHRLEGWDDKRIVVWRYDETDKWRTRDEFYSMAPLKRDAVLALLDQHPELVMNRRMSRREAWQAGNKHLIRASIFDLPLMLEDVDAKLATVRKNGIIGLRDQFLYGQDEILFHAQYTDMSGWVNRLSPGRQVVLWTTPWHQVAIIADPADGKIIGKVDLYKRAPMSDREAILEAAGAQNADLARKSMPFRGRHQQEAEARLAMIGINADVLSGRAAGVRHTALGDGAAADLQDLQSDATDTFWAGEDADPVLEELLQASDKE